MMDVSFGMMIAVGIFCLGCGMGLGMLVAIHD